MSESKGIDCENKKKLKAPCVIGCPANVDAEGYISLIAKGKYEEALALEREVNPFAAVCGRICPSPCERVCYRGKFDQPIAIRELKRFIADYEYKNKISQGIFIKTTAKKFALNSPIKNGAHPKVAIIGAGPAGLTCAYQLAKKGYIVNVFESSSVIGGMLALAIPEFRLPRYALAQDIEYIKSYGIEIFLNQTLGKDFSIDDLFEKGYKAIFLALGAHKEIRANIPGEDLQGVYYCIDFLKQLQNKKINIGKRVAVIGGGNSAVDSARVSLRLGAQEVYILYRRSRQEMPANTQEFDSAIAEGVKIEYLVIPQRIIGRNGKVNAIECIRTRLGDPDESGRRKPIPISGSEFELQIDTVIFAISQKPDLSCIKSEISIQTTAQDTIKVDPITYQTTREGVFAGGDVISGASTVINAIAQANEASVAIDRYLRGLNIKNTLTKKTDKMVPYEDVPKPVKKRAREKPSQLPLEQRIASFEEVNRGFIEEQAIEEARRCLNCGHKLRC